MAALIDTMSRFILARGMALSSLTAARTCTRTVQEGHIQGIAGAIKETKMDGAYEQVLDQMDGAYEQVLDCREKGGEMGAMARFDCDSVRLAKGRGEGEGGLGEEGGVGERGEGDVGCRDESRQGRDSRR
jgi:hypothetical protein